MPTKYAHAMCSVCEVGIYDSLPTISWEEAREAYNYMVEGHIN